MTHIDLTFIVKLPNSLSFENKILTLIKKPERNVYRYINTDMRKSSQFFKKIL